VNIYEKKQRWKYILLFSAVVIGTGSLFYTNRLVKTISEDEREKIELWAEATRILANPSPSGNDILFPLQVLENNTNIPVILTDAEGNIMA
jgi:two-component system, sporulation sensor kinase D